MNAHHRTVPFVRAKGNDHPQIVDCRCIRPSNSNPGYFKYIVTVLNSDGNEDQVPCYGKSMKDALSRLHWTVQTERAAKLVENSSFVQVLLALGVLVIFGGFALQAQIHDSALWLAAGFVLVLSMIGLASFWLHRLYKAVEEES